MADKKYDYVLWVKIGYDAGHCTQIDDLIYVADRIVTPQQAAELVPIETVNAVKPTGVSGAFKHWLIEIATDSHNYEAFYTQQTENGVAASRAIKDALDNSTIEYLVVRYVEDDGSTEDITYESGKVAVIGERARFSNRPEIEFHPTVYTLVCWGNRT